MADHHQRKSKFGFARRLTVGIILFGFLVSAAAIAVGVSMHFRSTYADYNDETYRIAASAASMFTEEELRHYAGLVRDYADGTVTEAALEQERHSDSYTALYDRVSKLRAGMDVNDIYIGVIDMDSYDNYTVEADESGEWRPLHYIIDTYYDEEHVFALGESGQLNPEYHDVLAQAYRSGEAPVNEYILSSFQNERALTAFYPVVYNEQTVAVICVEIPFKLVRTGTIHYILQVMFATTIATILFLIIIMFYTHRRLIRPIELMTKEAQRFTEKHEVVSTGLDTIRTKDELEQLSRSLLRLEQDTIDYVNSITEITSEKERISTELDVAADIQAGMLPSLFPAFPERQDFDIFATMTPAKEVGGDFYDFFMVDNDHLALVMADVSDKGVPAALFMVITKALIKNRAHSPEKISPARILHDVNDQLCEDNDLGLFVTVWLAVLELSTGKGIAANAGHEHPVLRRKDGSFEYVVYPHSPALAAMEGMVFSEHEFRMYRGDSLLVYTDGVLEAADAEDRLFGKERLLAALNKAPDAAPQELIENVVKDISAFVSDTPQFDDMTMLAFAYYGGVDSADGLTVEADEDNLYEVIGYLHDQICAFGCAKKTLKQIDVVAEEIFINIANYAYFPESGTAHISVAFSEEPRSVYITFSDSGRRYNPLEKQDPDLTLSSEEREIGGLGIYLVKQFADEVSYRYEGGNNHLTIRQYLDTE